MKPGGDAGAQGGAGRQGVAVQGPGGLDPAHGAGEEDLVGPDQLSARKPSFAQLDAELAGDRDRRGAGGSREDPPVRLGCDQDPAEGGEDICPARLQDLVAAIENQGDRPARDFAEHSAVGPLVAAEAARDQERAQVRGALPGREVVPRVHRGHTQVGCGPGRVHVDSHPAELEATGCGDGFAREAGRRLGAEQLPLARGEAI